MVRLSELRGVLFQLEQLAHKKGVLDPIVELFYQNGSTEELDIDLAAINADPEGQLTKGGAIHLPLKEIVTRGYVIVYGTDKGEDCIVIQATDKREAEYLFGKHFNYEVKMVSEQI
ncbi:hypothetical protein DQT32_04450 [Salmonella enterica subsp. enterica serovar Braenderup]|nr:hypothetical protein [Salmonella enterica subsp. enterica serovar Braenderup]